MKGQFQYNYLVLGRDNSYFFIYTKTLNKLYVRVDILLTRGIHFHDRIISIRGKGWAHETSVILPRYLNTCTKVDKWAVMYRCVTGIDFEIRFRNCSKEKFWNTTDATRDRKSNDLMIFIRLLVLSATFSRISAISWRGFASGLVNYQKRCTRLTAARDKV